MDFYRIIDDLIRERTRVERIIESLEALLSGSASEPGRTQKTRKGRKFMDPAGRKAVSERMKKYWAKRRAEPEGSSGPGPNG